MRLEDVLLRKRGNTAGPRTHCFQASSTFSEELWRQVKERTKELLEAFWDRFFKDNPELLQEAYENWRDEQIAKITYWGNEPYTEQEYLQQWIHGLEGGGRGLEGEIWRRHIPQIMQGNMDAHRNYLSSLANQTRNWIQRLGQTEASWQTVDVPQEFADIANWAQGEWIRLMHAGEVPGGYETRAPLQGIAQNIAWRIRSITPQEVANVMSLPTPIVRETERRSIVQQAKETLIQNATPQELDRAIERLRAIREGG